MKKGWMIIGLVVIVIAVYFLFYYKPVVQQEPSQTLPVAAASTKDLAFNRSFDSVLNAYFAVHDAFVNWDTVKANRSADTLAKLIEQVPFDLLEEDISVVATAKNFASSMKNEASAIVSSKNIEAKRRSYNILTENLYNLLRTIQYDNGVLYHQKCPMAFNDTEEAFWLANTREVVNPYLGNKDPRYKAGMLHCGETVDSIDYRK